MKDNSLRWTCHILSHPWWSTIYRDTSCSTVNFYYFTSLVENQLKTKTTIQRSSTPIVWVLHMEGWWVNYPVSFFPRFRGHTCSMWKNSRAEPFPFTNMDIFQVVVSTQLKNISQNWNLLRIRDEQNKIFETTTEFFGVLGLQVIQDSPPSK